MPQMNLHVTDEFNAELERYMRVRRLPSKSEAVRAAVHEALARSLEGAPAADFVALIGFASGGKPVAPRRFRDDAALWNR